MNDVCQKAIRENEVPNFRSDFRMAEFFNTIGSEPTCGSAVKVPFTRLSEGQLPMPGNGWLAFAENGHFRPFASISAFHIEDGKGRWVQRVDATLQP